jgi:hypothetical protein
MTVAFCRAQLSGDTVLVHRICRGVCSAVVQGKHAQSPWARVERAQRWREGRVDFLKNSSSAFDGHARKMFAAAQEIDFHFEHGAAPDWPMTRPRN